MRFLFLLLSLTFLLATPLEAALVGPAPPVQSEMLSPSDLSREAVEAQLGRKLKFTERIALSVVRGKAKKQARKLAKNGPDGKKTNGLALTSMILGILAFATAIFLNVFGGLFAIGAIVLGIIGLNRAKRNPGEGSGKGFAIAGIALGGAWIVLFLLALTLVLLAFGG